MHFDRLTTLPMRRYWRSLSLVLLCWSFAVGARAQTSDSTANAPRLYTGYGLHFSYNLYSWNRTPFFRGSAPNSSGQVLNVVPGIGACWWLGDVNRWTVSLSAEWEWLPFQVSLRHYDGLGAFRLPIMARVQVPMWKQQSLWVRLSVGMGTQWQRLGWYDRPAELPPTSAFFSGVVEVGVHLTAVGTHRQRLRELVVFARVGTGPQQAQSLHLGLRISFWNRLRRKNTSQIQQ